MLKGIYRNVLDSIALNNIVKTPDIPNVSLGVYPYENMGSIPLLISYNYSYPEKITPSQPTYNTKLTEEIYGSSLAVY